MASIIKADTLQSTTANVFILNSSGTEYARFNSSGNLGIGTTTPGAKLDVRGSSTFLINAANPTAWVSSDSTLVTQSMYMQVNTTSSDTRLGSYTNHPLLFLTNNAERMRINSGAPILCLSGGNTSATGTGIAFPATQSASSDANTLDDYEEGTWTPVLTSSGGAVTATYNRQQGKYVKIGNMVYISGSINTGTTAATPAGVARIGGLPFTSGNTNGEADRTTFTMGYIQFTASSTAQPRGLLLNANSTLADFYRADGADARSGFTTTVSQLDINTSGVNIYFSGTYFTPT